MSLQALIDAVEAGGEFDWGFASSPARKALPIQWHNAMNAYMGSFDAALSLYEALLPEWLFDVRIMPLGAGDFGCAIFAPITPTEEKFAIAAKYEGRAPIPSRALLLAILRAVEQNGTKTRKSESHD
jgi:hypothetical protein